MPSPTSMCPFLLATGGPAESCDSGGSAFSTWDITNPSSIEAVQTEKFKLDHPGTVPDRQDAPHPHEAVLDPTGKFILVPDLGADLVRLFSVGASGNLTVTSLPAVTVKAGSGPRHISFAVVNGKTFMYLVTEIASTIIGYEVTYPTGSIKLRELFNIGCHGAGKPVPQQAFASEIVVSVSTL